MSRHIHAVKDYAVRGYASSNPAIKPWIAYLDGRPLRDKTGRPRRFATEAAARRAAARAA